MQRQSGPDSEDGVSSKPHRNGDTRPVVISSTSKGPDTAVGNPDEIIVTVEYETEENILEAQVEFNITPSGEAQLGDVSGEGSRAEQYIPIAYAAQQVRKNPVVSRVPRVPSVEVVYSQLVEDGSTSKGNRQRTAVEEQEPATIDSTRDGDSTQKENNSGGNEENNSGDTANVTDPKSHTNEIPSSQYTEGNNSENTPEESQQKEDSESKRNNSRSEQSPSEGESDSETDSRGVGVGHSIEDELEKQNGDLDSSVDEVSGEGLENKDESSESGGQQTGDDNFSGEDNNLADIVTDGDDDASTETRRIKEDSEIADGESDDQIDPTLGRGWRRVEDQTDLNYIDAFAHDRGDSLSIWATEELAEGNDIDPEEQPYMIHYEYPDHVDKPNEQDFFTSPTSCNGVVEDLMQMRPESQETNGEEGVDFTAS